MGRATVLALSIAIVLVVAVSAYLALRTFQSLETPADAGSPPATAEPSGQTNFVREFTTPNEAETVVDYDVARPDWVPDGFALRRVTVTGAVSQEQSSYVVQQVWADESVSPPLAFRIEQAPGLRGLTSGTEVDDVGGEAGMKAEFGQGEGSGLALLRRDSGKEMGYVIDARLASSLSEETLLRIIESIP